MGIRVAGFGREKTVLSSFLTSLCQPCRGYQRLLELLIHECLLCHHRRLPWFQLLSLSLEGTNSAALGVYLCVSERPISGG